MQTSVLPGAKIAASASKRDAVRRAAGALFLAHGFERTSMDAVAREAGVSKNTVYAHFANKQSLFAAVIGHEVDRAGARFAGVVPDSVPLEAGLRLLGAGYQRLVFDAKTVRMFRVMVGESSAHPHVAEAFARAAHGMTQAVFERFLAARAAAGEIEVADVAAAADVLQALLRGSAHLRALMNLGEPSAVERAALLDQACAVFLARYAR